jgi:hypothetical protein
MTSTTIALALQLLGSPDVAVVVVDAAPASFNARQKRMVQAWVNEGEKTIFIAGWGDLYRRGNAIELAGAIAHEACHVAQGPTTEPARPDGTSRRPETPCYDVQIATLKRLGAPKSYVEQIEDVRHAFANKEKNR